MDRADEEGLYDILKKSGLIDAVIAEIDQEEKDNLWKDILIIKEDMTKYQNSFAGFLENILEDLEDRLKTGLDLIKKLNLDNNSQFLQMVQKQEEDIKAE